MLLTRSAGQGPFVSSVSTAIMTCACCGAMVPSCCPILSFHVAQVLLRLVSIYSMRFHFHAALMTAICRRVRRCSSPRGRCILVWFGTLCQTRSSSPFLDAGS